MGYQRWDIYIPVGETGPAPVSCPFGKSGTWVWRDRRSGSRRGRSRSHSSPCGSQSLRTEVNFSHPLARMLNPRRAPGPISIPSDSARLAHLARRDPPVLDCLPPRLESHAHCPRRHRADQILPASWIRYDRPTSQRALGSAVQCRRAGSHRAPRPRVGRASGRGPSDRDASGGRHGDEGDDGSEGRSPSAPTAHASRDRTGRETDAACDPHAGQHECESGTGQIVAAFWRAEGGDWEAWPDAYHLGGQSEFLVARVVDWADTPLSWSTSGTANEWRKRLRAPGLARRELLQQSCCTANMWHACLKTPDFVPLVPVLPPRYVPFAPHTVSVCAARIAALICCSATVTVVSHFRARIFARTTLRSPLRISPSSRGGETPHEDTYRDGQHGVDDLRLEAEDEQHRGSRVAGGDAGDGLGAEGYWAGLVWD